MKNDENMVLSAWGLAAEVMNFWANINGMVIREVSNYVDSASQVFMRPPTAVSRFLTDVAEDMTVTATREVMKLYQPQKAEFEALNLE